MSTKKKAAAKRKRWESYTDYLQSEEWQAIRDEVIERDDGECRFCGDGIHNDKRECHHWQYPKDWNDDSADNVILSCKSCHKSFHEDSCIKDMIGEFESADDCVITYLRYQVPEAYSAGIKKGKEDGFEAGYGTGFSAMYNNTCIKLAHLVLESNLKMSIEVYPDNMFFIGSLPVTDKMHRDVLEKVNDAEAKNVEANDNA